MFSSGLSKISENRCGKISPQTLEKLHRSLVNPYFPDKSVAKKFFNDSIIFVHGTSSDQCCRTLEMTLLVEMQYIEHLIKIAKMLYMQHAKILLLHEVYSREWFRSTDLWVMDAARFLCATLLAQLKLLSTLIFYSNPRHRSDWSLKQVPQTIRPRQPQRKNSMYRAKTCDILYSKKTEISR